MGADVRDLSGSHLWRNWRCWFGEPASLHATRRNTPDVRQRPEHHTIPRRLGDAAAPAPAASDLFSRRAGYGNVAFIFWGLITSLVIFPRRDRSFHGVASPAGFTKFAMNENTNNRVAAQFSGGTVRRPSCAGTFVELFSIALGAFVRGDHRFADCRPSWCPLVQPETGAVATVGKKDDFEIGKDGECDLQRSVAAGHRGRGLRRERAPGCGAESDESFIAFSVKIRTHLGCPVRWLGDGELFESAHAMAALTTWRWRSSRQGHCRIRSFSMKCVSKTGK